MKKFKVSRCEDSDYILDSKRRYGVEYISIDKDGNPIDFGMDYDYFNSELEAETFVKNYNTKIKFYEQRFI